MRTILLASHSYLAKGMKDTVEMILGEQDNLDILCAYIEEDFNIQEEINKRLVNKDSDQELIIITDIFGGSVNNEVITAIGKKNQSNIHLISGMNLGLIMGLLTSLDSTQDTSDLIDNAIEESKRMILNNNQFIFQNTVDVVLDDF